MTENDAAEWYDSLTSILSSAELRWVLNEVEEQASLGKLGRSKLDITEMSLSDEPDLLTPSFEKRRRTHGTFVVARQYSARERLELLIEAVRIAVPQHTLIAEHVTTYVDRQSDSAVAQFELALESLTGFTLSRQQVSAAVSAARNLDELLIELQREI